MSFIDRRRMLITFVSKSRLPNEYQEVEWIKTTQGGFINTKIVANFYDICEAKFMLHSWDSDAYLPTLSAYSHAYLMYNYAYSSYYRGFLPTNTWSAWAPTAQGGTLPRIEKNTVMNRIAYSANKVRYVKDLETNETLWYANFSSYYSEQAGGIPYAIFGRANSGSTVSSMTISYATEQTLYYLKLWRGNSDGIKGTLVRDFVPCYKKSNGVIGVFDLVSKTFFTNAGTGTFTKGADVN